jgi:uncharacterized protein (TIGR03437 family)
VVQTNHVVAQNYPDWTINSPSNPASPGQQVVVYWTGCSPDLPAAGQVSPAGGQQATPLSSYAATFDDRPAQLTFVGPTPGLAGVLQFNVVVPNVAPGEHRLDFWDNAIGPSVPGNETLISVGP